VTIWGVSEITQYLKELVESDPSLHDLWVEGEVSNFSISMAGHAFFTLKDAASQLRCVMFRTYLQRMEQLPQNGEKAIARGSVRVYDAQGVYQLYVEFIAPAGLGDAHIRLLELTARLEAEGLFEPSRKRPLPTWPRRIGVVTSAAGAVIHDIHTVIARRYPLVEIILAPTPVQGEDAAPRICQGIADLNQIGQVDVIILARGGGSREDLAPFNEEMVVRAIFASRAPVVSAVGHETDTTLADLVADQRAPTPSAAAEMVVPDVRELRQRIATLAELLAFHARSRLERQGERLYYLGDGLRRRSPLPRLEREREALGRLAERAIGAAARRLERNRMTVSGIEGRLRALDPYAILRRGFSVTMRAEDGRPVIDPGQVQPGTLIQTRVLKGAFNSRVIGEGPA